MPHNRWKKSSLLGRREFVFQRVPQFVAGGYAVVSVLWIAVSDRLLVKMAGGYSGYQTLQTLKGWFFVVVSSLLIYVLLNSTWRGLLSAFESLADGDKRLRLALAAARGGMWEIDVSDESAGTLAISPELVESLGFPEGATVTMEDLRARRHPDDVEEADHRLRRAIASGGSMRYQARYRVRTFDGAYRWVQSLGNVVETGSGTGQRMVGVALDIDEQVRAEEAYERLVRYDPVTGLSKQSKFLADVQAILASAGDGETVAVVQIKILDLDHLIADAETLEDAVLVRLFADRLHGAPGVVTSRLALDVFALATASAMPEVAAASAMRDVVAGLIEPFELNERAVKLRIQAGGALGFGNDTALGLLRNSGHVLGQAERASDVDIRWFNETLSAEFDSVNDRLRALGSAVARGEIECFYQPLVSLETGRTAGFEALARWRRESGELVFPDKFIALAEEIGKIAEIGEEVLAQACRFAASWPSGGGLVAVNVSPLQLQDPDFPRIVTRVLAETGLAASRLELEITESTLLRDPDMATERLAALRTLGVGIAIDDFGTGYSSLSLLSKIPFTRLKIDRSFVSACRHSREGAIIVDMIVELAHSLELSITAEGIEDPGLASLMKGKGVDIAQGFYFSKPVEAASAASQVDRQWTWEDR